MTERPPRIRTELELLFERLSPREFERFCFELLMEEGYTNLQHIGAAGRDRGIDILALRDGQQIGFQCKSVDVFHPKDAERAVKEVLVRPPHERPNKLILLVTHDVTERTRGRAQVQAGAMLCEIWSLTELDALANRYPRLLSRFFGSDLVPTTPEPESASLANKTPSIAPPLASMRIATRGIGPAISVFLVVCAFLGISVSSIDHLHLLRGDPIALPIYSVDVELELFFILAPLVLLVSHLYLLLLLRGYLLAFRMALSPNEFVVTGAVDLISLALLLNAFGDAGQDRIVRFMTRPLLFVVSMVLPQTLLLWIQIRFLPYHSFWLTSWHQTLLLFDIGLVCHFYWFSTAVLRKEGLRQVGVLSRIGQSFWIGASGLLALFCIFGAIVPGTGWEAWTGTLFPLANRLERDISVPGKIFVPAGGLSEEDLRRRGLRLAGRDLRNADFTDCQLPGANFRGADLEGASFTGADLRGAQFLPGSDALSFLDPPSPAKRRLAATEWQDRRKLKITNLRNTKFISADLQGASFLLADLDGASLQDASLGNAELLRASLRRAMLDGARLQGAELGLANLTGAYFRRTDLTGASLRGTYLLGANLDGARLWAADLSGAHLQGATFAAAMLDACDFQDAKTLGASFRNTSLRGAANLELEGVILRGSRIGGLARCASRKPPYLTDLRNLDFRPVVSPGSLTHLQNALADQIQSLKTEVQGKLQAEALERLAAHFDGPTCIVSTPSSLRHREVLYEEADRKGHMAQWPPTQSLAPSLRPGEVWGESLFYRKLARYLIEKACQDKHVATAMAFKIAEPHLSVDPALRVDLERWFRLALEGDFECAERDALLTVVCELGRQDQFLPKAIRCPGPPKLRWTRYRLR
jgi:uncharacterized protein YjbI with pentapeptide repeats